MSNVLLIDQQSASLMPSDTDVLAWAAGKRVFVSSLISDMAVERGAVRAAIDAAGAVPVMFEDLGAQDISAEQAYLAGVRSSDIYVGLWGPRYGVRMSDGYSATHGEFLEAERRGLRLCIFASGEVSGEMDGSQRDLISGARNLYTTGRWQSPEDLRVRVSRRLTDLAAEELAPWVRLGRVLFRANDITSDGATVTIAADVRSNAVHAELVRLRDNRGGDVPFASPTEAMDVRVDELSTTTVSTAVHGERLILTGRGSKHSSMRMALNGLSADEVAARALADGLFGTSTLGDASWGAQAVDPLESLRGLGLDDAVLRPVARLLIAEHLIQTESASTLDAFALGPAHGGARRLRVTWTPRATHINTPDPAPITIDDRIRDL